MTYLPKSCTLCPRECGADRTLGKGFCQAPHGASVASYMLHRFEEPVISGSDHERGSGTVFFRGCTMRCVYCQNSAISRSVEGEVLDSAALCAVFAELREMGAYNINLVSPTPYAPYIAKALELCPLDIPVVWNTGGYERVETVRDMAPYVDVWLTDLKYADAALSEKYSRASDYPERAFAALHEMVKVTGKAQYYNDGESHLMKRGVIVRHLCLPGHRKDTEAVLRRLAAEFDPADITLSLMSQYTPGFAPAEYKCLSRRLTAYEYDFAVDLAAELGLLGFSQERASSTSAYTPDFLGDKSTGENFR